MKKDREVIKEKLLLASVSPFASTDSASGHFYWMYRFLHDAQGMPDSPLTVGVEGVSDSHVEGLLTKQRPKQRLYIGSRGSLEHDESALLSWLQTGRGKEVTHVQCYDGALRELLLFTRLARKLPRTVFIFNFHWATDWIQLFCSSHIRQRLLRENLKRNFKVAPANLYFSAETEILAKEIRAMWDINVSVYPIFAMFELTKELPWKERKTDVLFLPQRPHEIEHCSVLAGLLTKKGLSTSIALVPEMKDRARSSPGMTTKLGNFGQVIELPLPNEEYQSALQSHRVVVLPYMKEYFRWGSSGKFNEAIALGTFPFVPSDTAIASQSRLGPEPHQYSPLDFQQARDLITMRLREGFPMNLSAIHFGDLVSWVSRSIPTVEKASAGVRKLPSQAPLRALEISEGLWLQASGGARWVAEKILIRFHLAPQIAKLRLSRKL